MSKSAISMFVFSLYLFIIGPLFMIVPNFLLSLVGLPETSEVWVRLVGMLATALGFYYMHASLTAPTTFFQASIYGRCGVLVGLTIFALLGFTRPTIIIFGVFDALGALWTGLCLRAEKRASSQ